MAQSIAQRHQLFGLAVERDDALMSLIDDAARLLLRAADYRQREIFGGA
jgi:hypothetical protein